MIRYHQRDSDNDVDEYFILAMFEMPEVKGKVKLTWLM